jgi:hypothetical protein
VRAAAPPAAPAAAAANDRLRATSRLTERPAIESPALTGGVFCFGDRALHHGRRLIIAVSLMGNPMAPQSRAFGPNQYPKMVRLPGTGQFRDPFVRCSRRLGIPPRLQSPRP